MVADNAGAHQQLATVSTMTDNADEHAEPTDIQGFLEVEKIQQAAEKLGMNFKVVSSKAHHNVGLAEDISRRIKLLAYDVFRFKCKNIFSAFRRAALLEERINDRIIAINTDGTILSPNSFLYAAGLHSNQPIGDLTGLSSLMTSKNPGKVRRKQSRHSPITTSLTCLPSRIRSSK